VSRSRTERICADVIRAALDLYRFRVRSRFSRTAVGSILGNAATRSRIFVRRRRMSHIDCRLTPIPDAIFAIDRPDS
jgi:hypothetical protein